MSQRPSQGGGAAAEEGEGSQGPTSADGEVRIGLNDLILVNGPGAPRTGFLTGSVAPLLYPIR